MKILISTDHWPSHDESVVTSENMRLRALRREKHDIILTTPNDFWNLPIPLSRGKKLTFPFGLQQSLKSFQPDAVHIMTEGSLGLATRSICLHLRIPFTTECNAELLASAKPQWGVLKSIALSYSRWFHGPSSRVLCPSAGAAEDAQKLGIAEEERISVLGRGVDKSVFRPPYWKKSCPHVCGRNIICVSPAEKGQGVEEFCSLSDHGYECTLVGGGALLPALRKRFPKVRYKGELTIVQCASEMRDHSIFVSPRTKDRNGHFMPEANSCGLPIVAFPTESSLQWVENGKNGICAEDTSFDSLLKAVGEAFAQCSPKESCNAVREYSWENSARRFVAQLERIPSEFYS